MSVDDYRARLAQGEEITFTQSRGVLLLGALGCLAFVLVSLWLALGDMSIVAKLAGWAGILFVGVIGIPALLFRAIRPAPQLAVSAEKGVWLAQGDDSWVAWGDIEEVALGEISGQKMVAIGVNPELYERRFADSSVATRGLASANEMIVGGPGLVIPTGLPIKPAALADWLGAERAERGRTTPGS